LFVLIPDKQMQNFKELKTQQYVYLCSESLM
jgi:hypothetical protein